MTDPLTQPEQYFRQILRLMEQPMTEPINAEDGNHQEIVEEVEEVFDRLYIMLATLSDSASELEEIENEYHRDDPAFMVEIRGLVSRYDYVASDARNQVTGLRGQILASLSGETERPMPGQIDHKRAAQLGVYWLNLILADFEPGENGVYPTITPAQAEEMYLFLRTCLHTEPVKSVAAYMQPTATAKPTYLDGVPTNLEAAALDAKDWLDWWLKFVSRPRHVNYIKTEDLDRLRLCRDSLAEFLPDVEPVFRKTD